MDRRKFISLAAGAVVIPQLPKVLPVMQENYSIFDIEVAGQSQFMYLESTSQGMDVYLEWQEYMIRVVAAAFDVSPYLLGRE